jgi:metal-responsive CopG/Arc/MetJ family transcriptional regulator
LADTEKLSRSELIREALKTYMRRLSKTQIEMHPKTQIY